MCARALDRLCGYAQEQAGSPIIIAEEALGIARSRGLRLTLIFLEKNEKKAQRLEEHLAKFIVRNSEPVSTVVLRGDSHDLTAEILRVVPSGTPSFFFVDPYGYPLSVTTINAMLERQRAEVLLNLMWYQINRDLTNPKATATIDRMFGQSDWREQPFVGLSGREREEQFLQYFCAQIGAEYAKRFRILFSPEDRIKGGEKRTKYYLIHFCNHFKAASLMKSIMWGVGEEEGTFDFAAARQGALFSRSPCVENLREALKSKYAGTGRSLTFLDLQKETFDLPFIEKHYREAVRILERDGLLSVKRVQSKMRGIAGGDIIVFQA